MGVEAIPGSSTPKSGWHFVCPCGWNAHSHDDPPTEQVRSHRAQHVADIVAMRRLSAYV